MLQKHYTSMHSIKACSYARYCTGTQFETQHIDQEIKVLQSTTNIYLHRAGGTIMVYLKIKRLIDIILSTLGLIILSPVFLVLIIAIKVDSPGPVLFKQKRVGSIRVIFIY